MEKNRLIPILQFVFFFSVVGFFSLIYSPQLQSTILLYIVFGLTSAVGYVLMSYTGLWEEGYAIGVGDPDKSMENLGAGVVTAAIFIVAGLATGGMFTSTVVETPVDFTVAVVLAPLVEELFFSGFMLPVLIKFTSSYYEGFMPESVGAAIGILLTSVSFAIYHQYAWSIAGLQAFLFYFLLRALLSMIVLARRSILPAIAAHMALNFTMYLSRPEPEAVALLAFWAAPMLYENRLLEKFDITSDDDVLETMSITYAGWAGLSPLFLYVFVSAWMATPPGAEYVEIPQLFLTLPANLMPVLVTCHAALIPLTALLAYMMRLGNDMWKPMLAGFTMMNVIMAAIEFAFRGPYTWIVPCVCLIDTMTDALTYALLKIVD